jgi:D-alanyl-D-alanine carboxypeptidase
VEASAAAAARGPDAALDRALKELVRMDGGPPGTIAVVQRGQHREVHTFGVANHETKRRMRVDDRMLIASTAKAFSGAVALSLVSKGALSLDDTIGERLADLPGLPEGMPEEWHEVTLRQLLNHTSGLPVYSGEALQTAIGEGRLRHPDPPKRLLAYAYDHDSPLLSDDPGTQYQYSNSDNVAVALMVEDATGEAYEDQLRKRVYRPLGLSGTSLPVGLELTKPFIHGYDLSESPTKTAASS